MKKIDNKMIGSYVVVRCHDAGIHTGVLESYQDRQCVLTQSRRLWFWKVPMGCGAFLSGLANHGLDPNGGVRVGEEVARIHLTENCEIILASPDAEKSIREIASHVRSR